MGGKPKGSSEQLKIQRQQFALTRQRELKTEAESASRKRAILNAQNARAKGFTLITVGGSGVQSKVRNA